MAIEEDRPRNKSLKNISQALIHLPQILKNTITITIKENKLEVLELSLNVSRESMIIVDKVQAAVMPETEPLKMLVAARTSTPQISMLQNQGHMELKRSNKHQTNMVSGKQSNSLNLPPS